MNSSVNECETKAKIPYITKLHMYVQIIVCLTNKSTSPSRLIIIIIIIIISGLLHYDY